MPDDDGHLATTIYIASPEGDTGKSTIALGILHRLTAMVARVGVFRPITRLGERRDYILELLLAHSTAGLPYEECVGVDYQRLHEDPDGAIADIVARFHRMAAQCDAVLVVGSDYTDVATPSELSVNARIAASGLAVVSVDYTTLPDIDLPGMIDQCAAAADWAFEHAQSEFGVTPMFIGGESAGAHLAACALLRLRDVRDGTQRNQAGGDQ